MPSTFEIGSLNSHIAKVKTISETEGGVGRQTFHPDVHNGQASSRLKPGAGSSTHMVGRTTLQSFLRHISDGAAGNGPGTCMAASTASVGFVCCTTAVPHKTFVLTFEMENV